jgi:ribosome-binding ATPase YchF (GTP1/OBG family)
LATFDVAAACSPVPNKMRVETKTYVVQDYDLVNFRFKK